VARERLQDAIDEVIALITTPAHLFDQVQHIDV
jgi:hypothetical protein